MTRVRRTKIRGGRRFTWGLRNLVSSKKSVEEPIKEHVEVPVEEHIGISLDWDGCGYVLPALFMLMTNKSEEERKYNGLLYVDGDNHEQMIDDTTRKIAQKLVKIILKYLPHYRCVVHMFIGSSRQSHDIDNDLYHIHKQHYQFGTYMYGYWKTLEEVMNKLYPQHNWIFETGSCSDHENALEKPETYVTSKHYGKGFENGLPLNHDFDFSRGSNPQHELNLKDTLNRYHAWRLRSVYGGNHLIFFDDRIEFVESITKIVEPYTYPPDMMINGHYFNSDSNDILKDS